MKYLTIIMLLLAVALIMGSCEYDNPQPFPEVVDTVSFSADIIPYFDQSCNMGGCHITGAVKPDLTAANAYSSLFAEDNIDLDNPEDSKLYTKIDGGSMAQYSTPASAALVLAWIKQGALDN